MRKAAVLCTYLGSRGMQCLCWGIACGCYQLPRWHYVSSGLAGIVQPWGAPSAWQLACSGRRGGFGGTWQAWIAGQATSGPL